MKTEKKTIQQILIGRGLSFLYNLIYWCGSRKNSNFRLGQLNVIWASQKLSCHRDYKEKFLVSICMSAERCLFKETSIITILVLQSLRLSDSIKRSQSPALDSVLY